MPSLPSSIGAYFVSDDYWHAEVWLRSSKGEKICFFSAEHSVAPLFDVSVLEAELRVEEPPNWTLLDNPIAVAAVEPLWREEWLVRGASGPTVGTDPHTQSSGPLGTTPKDAVATAVVFAGLFFRDADGFGVTVIASQNAPINIDIEIGGRVAEVVKRHTRGGWNNAV